MELEKLLENLIETINCGDNLNLFQVGITLKVMEDHLWNIDPEYAQVCNDLQHKIIKEGG